MGAAESVIAAALVTALVLFGVWSLLVDSANRQ